MIKTHDVIDISGEDYDKREREGENEKSGK
jgi:hypothetical protein